MRYNPAGATQDSPSQRPLSTSGNNSMKISSAIRIALVALTASAGAMLSSVAHADEGTIAMTIY